MKFLFVQKSGLPWHGVMSLSAILKQNGIDTDLILADEDKPLPYIRKYNPDFVGFHVISGEHPWVIGLCKEIKENFPKVRTVAGGPHATFCPETLVDYVDYVVRGEADNSILEVCKSESISHGIVPLSPLVQNLSSLPTPDRSVYYDKYPHLEKSTVKQFLTGRGCPFNCSFCCNHLAKRLYSGQRWVRRRLPEEVITELSLVKSRYGFKTISFSDDVFALDKKWLTEFLGLYKQVVKSLFMCNIRCDLVNPELVELLRDGGCYGLEMGVESGNERIRQDILTKNTITNQQIINAGKLVKSYGLVLKTFNMIGIPTETIDNCFETVKVNQEMKPDHASCTFLIPYPEYDVAKHFEKLADPLLDKLSEGSYLQPSEQLDNRIINLQTFFFIAVKFPWLSGAVKWLIKFPPNVVYKFVAFVMYGLFMAKCHKLTVGDIVRYGMHIKPNRL